MRLLFKLLLAIILILPIALVAMVYLAIDTSPSVHRAADITPASIDRAKRIVDQNDPRKMKPGARRTISVRENDLDLAANYLARQYAGGGARVELKRGAAHLAASLRIPALPVAIYLNLETQLAEGASLPQIDRLRIGSLSIPGWLANWMIAHLLAGAVEKADLRSLGSVIQKVSLYEDRVAATYRWQADLPDKLRTVLLPTDDQERLRIYQQRLAEVSKSLNGPTVSMADVLAPLLTLANERSDGGNAIAENRAAILLLTLYVNKQDVGNIVPKAAAWPRPQSLGVMLNGRADLAKHFIVSAALAAKAGGPLSDAVGLYKELADAREGSGFSFADMAADRAGTRLGEYASEFGSARALQQRARAGLHEKDLMPPTQDLPEFLPESEFIKRFGGVDSPAYNNMMAQIDRRIAALPLYR
jgi:hypothetical protein